MLLIAVISNVTTSNNMLQKKKTTCTVETWNMKMVHVLFAVD